MIKWLQSIILRRFCILKITKILLIYFLKADLVSIPNILPTYTHTLYAIGYIIYRILYIFTVYPKWLNLAGGAAI